MPNVNLRPLKAATKVTAWRGSEKLFFLLIKSSKQIEQVG
jgi:hypothetical protein